MDRCKNVYLTEVGLSVYSQNNLAIVSLTDSNLNPGIEISRIAFEEEAQAVLLFPRTKYTPVAVELAKANYSLPPERRLRLLEGDALYSGTTLTNSSAVEDLTLAVL